MLFLLFHLGPDRYALDVRQLVEVVPLLGLRSIPHSARGVAGIINYRGQPVPVVDLTELALGKPSAEQFSTRILIVNHPDVDGNPRLLGLIAEQATGMIRKQPEELREAGVRIPQPPYLGPLVMDERGLIQCLQPQHLLDDTMRDLVFSQSMQPGYEAL